jgi:hypothetical protein
MVPRVVYRFVICIGEFLNTRSWVLGVTISKGLESGLSLGLLVEALVEAFWDFLSVILSLQKFSG